MSICIPLWLLRDLKCRHCKNFLSSGPVYVTPDCGLLCGRCKFLAKPNFRNFVYEELASTFRFPCQNWEKHCPVEGDWNTLKEHEIDCPYGGSCGLICMDPAAFFSARKVLPNEENLLYLEVPDKCLNLVSCKNCGKYLSCEPVHINIVGSNICHRCYLSNGIPPQTIRNLGYEKLANIFRFPCIFRAKGCPIKFKFGRDSWEHEVACHYRDIKIPSTPSTPVIDCYLHPSGIDNSGYRPSFEGYVASLSHHASFDKERPPFELPRVSYILENSPIEKDLKKTRNETDKFIKEEYKRSNSPGKDKEKGVVPTHTGHVYATLSQNAILFAPPQIQPNKDPSNGIKVTMEFQDKIRRNASNASKNESVGRKIRNSVLSDTKAGVLGNKIMDRNTNEIPPLENISSLDFPALNKHQIIDLEKCNEDLAPVVKEYVQYNPQNNIQRNDSMTIGNADLIAELKLRNQQRRRRERDENFNDIEVH